jgi:iron complex outermembrane receptor protein
MSCQRSKFLFAATLVLPGTSFALGDVPTLEEVVVTASPMSDPLTVVTDPKAPRQPLPAHDGADYLKTIPGFSVIRKGGTDGDPVFRGMAGSRLNILLDGEQILGGCGGRMDPPTAYVFPEAYDRITILKGPQTVLHGPGNSAGTVLFEREVKRFARPGWQFNGSAMFGSFGRNDQVADVRAGTPDFYIQGTATNSDSDDYRDGDGRPVHSRYTRWSANAALGWTPDDHTRFELSTARSDGEAAYADRTMDGSKFARENAGLKFVKRRISPLLEKFEAQLYYNYIDHVMDNFSLRTPSGMRMLNNPDRETVGGRLVATLRLGEATEAALGADTQRNVHTVRSSLSAPRAEDMNFRQAGLFGEIRHFLDERNRLIGGLRVDRSRAEDRRATKSTYGQSDDSTLTSGFGRYERDLAGMAATAYVGLGHVERAPDYWERNKGTGAASTFLLKPEKTTQLDAGLLYRGERLSGSVSAFYGKIRDYILIQGGALPSGARNVAATTWGTEAGLSYALSAAWRADASVALVHSDNDTDGRPLAQTSPAELRLGLGYDDKIWSFGTLLRLVAEQDRVDPNQGNIVGQDIGRTPGFAVLSLNGGWRPKKGVLLSGGVDNVFDRTYAEHVSRAGAMVAGYTQTTRVNEPGRTVWIRAQIALD